MSSEQLKPSAEHGERPGELEAARAEKLEELRETAAEHSTAEHPEKRAEQAREVIGRQEPTPEPEPAANAESKGATPLPAFLNHHLNYSQTLSSVQHKLSPVSRSFSRVIHAPLVEKASEALETTVARPSVMAGSTWTALVVGAIFYFTARHYGYRLSGSELLFSFIVGALLGILGEGAWRTLRNRR